MKKSIIVLGAAGNLGMYYIDHLLNNLDMNKYEIIATGTRDKYPFGFYDGKYVKLNILNKDDFNKLPQENVECVVDFAGVLPAYKSDNDDELYIDVNIKGTLNILNYCKKSGANRVIYMQTWSDLNGYLKDDKPLKPYDPPKLIKTGDHAIYCITKSAGVELMKHFYAQYRLKYSVFRLPNIYLYSPDVFYYVNGEKKYISYRYIIEKAIKGEDIELWGNPEFGKDIIYVKDLCQMIYKAMFCNKDEGIYNAGTGIKTTMKEQIEGIIKVFSPKDKQSKIIYCPDKKDCDNFVMDIENIKEDLGYVVEYPYLKYLEDYKKEKELSRFNRE